jgi:hypothetical protein
MWEEVLGQHDCELEPEDCPVQCVGGVVESLANAILLCSDVNWHGSLTGQHTSVAEAVAGMIERCGRLVALLTTTPHPTAVDLSTLLGLPVESYEPLIRDQEMAAQLLDGFTHLVVQLMPSCREITSAADDLHAITIRDALLHGILGDREAIEIACLT